MAAAARRLASSATPAARPASTPSPPATERGAAAFSLHPLQTFPTASCRLTGTAAAIAGSDERARASPRAWRGALGMRPFEVPEERGPPTTPPPSIASNFLVALEESAAELLAAGRGRGPAGAARPARPAHRGELGRARPERPHRADRARRRGDRRPPPRGARARRAPELLDALRALAERDRGDGRAGRRRRREGRPHRRPSCATRCAAAPRGPARSASCRPWATCTTATSR